MNNENKKDKLLFSMPNFFSGLKTHIKVLDLMKEHPEWFYDDAIVDSIYDGPICEWAGGRFPFGPIDQDLRYMFPIDKMEKIINILKERNITTRFVFNNILIQYEDIVENKYGLSILELINKYFDCCDLTLSSPALYFYIKKHYPKIKCNWSTTLNLNDIEWTNQLSFKDLVIVDYDLNNEFGKIKQFRHPENIEFLATDGCLKNCKNRLGEQLATSARFLSMFDDEKYNKYYDNLEISVAKSNIFPEEIQKMLGVEGGVCERYNVAKASGLPYYSDEFTDKFANNIKLEDMRNRYIPLGMNKFKLTGRQDKTNRSIICGYKDFFVKPEYKELFEFRINNILK